MFVTSFPKSVLDAIVTQYFKNLGIIDHQARLDVTSIELKENEFQIEADITEETLN